MLLLFFNCKNWKSEQYVLFALKFAVDHTAQNFYWTQTRWGVAFWNLTHFEKFEWGKIDVTAEWWKSTKISKKGPKRVVRRRKSIYVGRPISAHHDTPWALSAFDVTGFMVIDSAHSTVYMVFDIYIYIWYTIVYYTICVWYSWLAASDVAASLAALSALCVCEKIYASGAIWWQSRDNYNSAKYYVKCIPFFLAIVYHTYISRHIYYFIKW